MSSVNRVTSPGQRVNSYTVLIDEGAKDGISEGDKLLLSYDDHTLMATVVDVGESKSVIEIDQ